MVAQTKVFVGTLPQGTKPEELRRLFEKYGEVTECDIMNRCGFVHMQTEEQANAAIRALHNTTFNGGVLCVERGRMKERGQRGGGGGGRGGMRGGMRNGGMDRRSGGPMRGQYMGGGRDAPYARDRPMGPMRGGDMRGPMGGGGNMGMRNSMGGGAQYDRGMDRGMSDAGGASGYVDDRYGGYGDDRRGFAMMDSRGGRGDPYAAQVPVYPVERRGYATAAVDDMQAMYPEDRRAPMYADERDMMDRRAAPMRGAQIPVATGYDRGVQQRAAPMGNGDMFSRRATPPL